jgi:anti-sigma factor RsiW
MTRDQNGRGPDETLDERLSAWLDGELDAAAETELRAELEADPALAARLAQLQGVDDALRALPEPALRPDLEAQLRERIAAVDGRKTPRTPAGRAAPPRRSRWLVPVLAAAAAAVFALLALPRLREPPSPGESPLARTPAPRPAPEAIELPRPPVPSLEPAPVPEELALAVEIESDTDLEVIEMLDWLEALGEIESS